MMDLLFIYAMVVSFLAAAFGIKNLYLWKRNRKLESDVDFWRNLSFENKPDLSDPKNADFLRPEKH